MKIVFMGTPEFSVPALEALHDAGHEVVCVYTQPPRPAGRGKKDRPSPVHVKAAELGLRVRHPASLKSEEEQTAFANLGADVAVVVAYGLILPEAILEAPRCGALNIHASLLPRWRGAAPIHRAVMAGDDETGIAIMRMEAGLDTGPVLLERRVRIGGTETTGDLHRRLSVLGGEAIVEALRRLDELTPKPQPDAGATYASKIDKTEARIDWSLTAKDVDRLIRGLSPFPGAWTMAGDERLKVLRSQLSEGKGEPGQHLGDFRIACGEGAVEVIEAQREGRAPMAAAALLRGMELPDKFD